MVLYINGNYPHHSLHSELVSKLADLGHEITVFVPMKGKSLEGKYVCKHPMVEVLYSDCLKTSDKLLFMRKIHRIVQQIKKDVDVSKVDCILAGTLYSDGMAAYMLRKKYGIPFSVAVRQTDITYQMKWRPYLNGFVKQLLQEASKVIFLSPAYQQYLNGFGCDRYKFVTIPNAVNDFWFQNSPKARSIHHPVSLIYVGELTENKNVGTTISVIAELEKRGISAEFHIVGSGEEENNCRLLAKKLGVEKQVFFHGWQKDKERIKEFYDQADIFIMLSHRETFGTVYIEALSQGLPVLYTRGQGIDGYFEDGSVGYACDPTDVDEAANRVMKILESYPVMSNKCIKESQVFKWDVVANQYNNAIISTREK